MLKTCSRCGIEKPIEELVGIKRKQSDCKPCRRAISNAYRAKNVDRVKAYRDSRKEKMKLYFKTRYEQKKDEMLPQMKARYEQIKGSPEFKASRSAYFKAYKQTSRAKALHRAKENKLRALKLQATPIWANQDKIKEIYLNCPPGHHVDHIVPLKGRNVCSLHVECNLQYLPAHENLKKSNRFSEGAL